MMNKSKIISDLLSEKLIKLLEDNIYELPKYSVCVINDKIKPFKDKYGNWVAVQDVQKLLDNEKIGELIEKVLGDVGEL